MYVNDAPHIGHAYEVVIGDAVARWHRLLGDDVRFVTGTDEYGLKNKQAAEAQGIEPQGLADRNSLRFREAADLLHVDYDDFIRTTEERHTRSVQKFLQAVFDNGDIERDTYEGLYCVSCEAYYTEDELVDGNCPVHGRPVEWVKEENWFFRLSRYQQRLLDWYDEHPDAVIPGQPPQRGAGVHPVGPARTSRSAAAPSGGASRCPGTRSRWPGCGSTPCPTTSPPPATATTTRVTGSRVRALVAGRLPPDRQGHHPLPRRLLAGHADGGGAGAAPAGRGPRLPAAQRREDLQDQAEPDQPPGGRRRVRRRPRPLPLPAGDALRPRRRLLRRGPRRPLQLGSGQQPGQPAVPGGHRGRRRSAAASAPRPDPMPPWPRRPPTPTAPPPRRGHGSRRRRPSTPPGG